MKRFALLTVAAVIVFMGAAAPKPAGDRIKIRADKDGVRVKLQSVEAVAKEVTYDQDSGELVLVGSKDSPATFRYFEEGNVKSQVSGGKITYSIKSRRVKTEHLLPTPKIDWKSSRY